MSEEKLEFPEINRIYSANMPINKEYVNRASYYLAYPSFYQSYAYFWLRPCLEWFDGRVQGIHNESNGIIYDDYYNNDIFCMNLAEFNVMPDKLFETDCENDDILVVWVDSSSNVPRSDVNEVEYLEDRLSNMNYMYFCNESSDVISDAVLKYVYAEQSEKEEILKDFL